MNNASKNDAQAWMGSVLFHVLIFLVAAFGGVFAKFQAPPDSSAIDVVLYDADFHDGRNGGGGGGGGGSPAPKANAAAPAEEVVLSSDTPAELPKENSVSENPVQSEQQTADNTSAAETAGTLENATGTGGSGTGTGGGNGSGIGEGTGSGTGPGAGSGSGGGIGSGTGTGVGSGNGDGSSLRPKTPPMLLSAAEPVYPERLRREGAEGSVSLRLIVAADGSVEEASVSESSGYSELDEAAVSAAYEYRFEPAENAYGEPVRCAISTAVHFRLN